MKVIVMSGVSGSGKSTYARKLLGLDSEYYLGLCTRAQGPRALVSADLYFMNPSDEYVFDRAKIGEAHAECFRNFIELLQKNRFTTVVVDNTNTTVEEIAPYMAGAAAYGYEAEIVTVCPEFATDSYFKLCAARNAHGVPLDVIVQQHLRIYQRRLPNRWKHKQIVLDG